MTADRATVARDAISAIPAPTSVIHAAKWSETSAPHCMPRLYTPAAGVTQGLEDGRRRARMTRVPRSTEGARGGSLNGHKSRRLRRVVALHPPTRCPSYWLCVFPEPGSVICDEGDSRLKAILLQNVESVAHERRLDPI